MSFRFTSLAAATGLLLLAGSQDPAGAQGVTTTRIAAGLSDPLWAGAPVGDSRIFVAEQTTGRIRIIDSNGTLLPTPFLNIGSKISAGGERGLLGVAFHPNYASNGLFFVNYTGQNPTGRTVVARYQVSANPNVADPSSELIFISENQPFSNHNAGGIEFGPDGYLYIAMGDGGSANDPGCRAQDPAELLGKMLRIDVDTPGGPTPYSIPADNPFVGSPGFLPEIWHLGLRNPYRFSFDRQTGEMYIGDVGQDAREEVSYAPAGVGGLNYGWRIMEGTLCNGSGSCPPAAPACNSPALTLPIHQYNHQGLFGGPCTVIGGYVYRGTDVPSMQGTYFFADYCSNNIWSFQFNGTSVTNFTEVTSTLAPGGGLSINSITSFGETGSGELLIVDQGGEIFQMVPVGGCGVSQYGLGLGGANIATLDSASGAGIGQPIVYDSTGYNGSGTATLILSANQASTPLLGATILIDYQNPLLTQNFAVTGGSGSTSVTPPNNPALVGFTAYGQTAMPDGSQSQGWAFTNGLAVTLCP